MKKPTLLLITSFLTIALFAQSTDFNPITRLITDHKINLIDWTNNYLQTLKGQPSGNLRLIGERSDYYEIGSSSWVFDDSLHFSYDNQNGNVLTRTIKNYNTMSSLWENSYRTQYSYDANGWLIEEVNQTWNGASWDNDYKYSYTRNGVGLATEKLNLYWNGASWQNYGRILYSYNTNNLIDVYTSLSWNNGTLTWDPDFRFLYQYDSYGNCNLFINQDWNGSNWLNDYKSNRYFIAYNKFHYGYSYDWDNISNSWIYNTKDTVLFTGSNTTEEYHYNWDNISSSWKNDYKNLLTYTPSNIILQLTQITWDNINSLWINNYRYAYTVDAQENYSSYLEESWDDITSTWVNSFKSTYFFNSENYQTYYKNENWNTGLSQWVNDYQRYFWYEANPFASIVDVSNKYQLKVYPNPSSDVAILNFSISKPESITINIFNLSGSLVYQKQLTNSVGDITHIIHISELSSGTYILQLQTENGIINKKLIKQ
ncbi:MAG: T9SS type A sorting domain-containing protein [Flavobacteriales bacterium]|nr:T9SS type A sorting domain-containing protein [Flavobacteriales bacterium]